MKNMKKTLFLILATFIATGASAQDQEMTVSDKQNSGCVSRAPSYASGNEDETDTTPKIILEKEGSILSVQLQNYISNCATYDFDIKSSMGEGHSVSSCSLSIDVAPVPEEALVTCTCPFNISFTVRGLEQNSFYLKCWWYEGLVELTEGERLTLKDTYEAATIDGTNYILRNALRQAVVMKSSWSGEVCIPSELSYGGQTYSVKSISMDAFSDNKALTKVTIPRTVTNTNFDEDRGVDGNLFAGCSALEMIEVEEGNPALCAVDGVLFNKDKTRLYSYPAASRRSSYTVPESVTRVDNSAFGYSKYLVNITLPDNVTILGNAAFYHSPKLEEVRLSSNLKILSGWTFADCKRIESVTIPDGVYYLGGRLFSGSTNLTSITMPASVTMTENYVFENCTSLKHVNLSPNLERIDYGMFLNCSSLTEIQIPESVTEINSEAFSGCTALRTLDLPESVYRIGSNSFSGCKLESLYIRGIIESRWITSYMFGGMGTDTKVYVQPSEVEKFQRVYKGKVYPLPDQEDGISDIIHPTSNSYDLFDLSGRRVVNPKRGIYIQGNKKIVKR
jgi:hypothetical protein